jgi:hypothetical protein
VTFERRVATSPTLTALAERGFSNALFVVLIFCSYVLALLFFFRSIYGDKFADENFKARNFPITPTAASLCYRSLFLSTLPCLASRFNNIQA